MTEFTITYTVTERTRWKRLVEADSAEEAVELVKQYEFDNSEGQKIESLEWTVDDVELA